MQRLKGDAGPLDHDVPARQNTDRMGAQVGHLIRPERRARRLIQIHDCEIVLRVEAGHPRDECVACRVDGHVVRRARHTVETPLNRSRRGRKLHGGEERLLPWDRHARADRENVARGVEGERSHAAAIIPSVHRYVGDAREHRSPTLGPVDAVQPHDRKRRSRGGLVDVAADDYITVRDRDRDIGLAVPASRAFEGDLPCRRMRRHGTQQRDGHERRMPAARPGHAAAIARSGRWRNESFARKRPGRP